MTSRMQAVSERLLRAPYEPPKEQRRAMVTRAWRPPGCRRRAARPGRDPLHLGHDRARRRARSSRTARTSTLPRNTCALMAYGEDEVLFNMFPLYHVNARYTSVLPAMWLDRGTCVLHDRFSASRFWDICRAEGVDRVQLHGRARADALQAARAGRRRRQPGPLGVRRAGARRRARALRAAVRRRADRGLRLDGARRLPPEQPRRPPDRLLRARRRRTTIVEIHDEDDNPRRPGDRGRDRGAPARAARHGRGVLRQRPRRRSRPSGTSGSTPATAAASTRTAGSTTSTGSRTRSAGAARTSRRGRSSRSVNDHEAVAESAAIGVPSELTEEEVMVVVVPQDGAELDAGGAARLLPGPAPALRRAALRPLRRRAPEEPCPADPEAGAARRGRHRRTRGTARSTATW